MKIFLIAFNKIVEVNKKPFRYTRNWKHFWKGGEADKQTRYREPLLDDDGIVQKSSEL